MAIDPVHIIRVMSNLLTVIGKGILVKFLYEEWDQETWQKSLIGKAGGTMQVNASAGQL